MPCFHADGYGAVSKARRTDWTAWRSDNLRERKKRTASRRGPGGGDDVKPSA